MEYFYKTKDYLFYSVSLIRFLPKKYCMQIKSLLLLSVIVFAIGACKKKKDDPGTFYKKSMGWSVSYEGTMTDHSNAAFGWMDNTYQYTLQTSGAATDQPGFK